MGQPNIEGIANPQVEVSHTKEIEGSHASGGRGQRFALSSSLYAYHQLPAWLSNGQRNGLLHSCQKSELVANQAAHFLKLTDGFLVLLQLGLQLLD